MHCKFTACVCAFSLVLTEAPRNNPECFQAHM